MAISIQQLLISGSPIGYTGSIGDIGFTGSQGDIGFTGSQGVGFTGSQGDTGFTGSQGVGFTGSQGVGFTGSQGDIGFTGSQGVGFTGSQGDIGYTGSQGDIGYTGSSGDTGFTGSQGPIGFTGSQGGLFGIEAERNNSVALDSFFAFGNGAGAVRGVRIPVACTLTYITIQAETAQTAITVEVFVNGVASGQTVSLSSSDAASSAELSYSISAGDSVSFKCVSGSSSSTTVVGAWFSHDGVKGYTGSIGGVGFTGSKGELGIAGFLADVSNTAPNTTTEGHMWFDTNDASLSIYYDDGDSEQWVTVTGARGLNGYTGSAGFTGSQGDIGFTGSQGNIGFTGSQGVGFTGSTGTITETSNTAPESPVDGQMWFNTNDGSVYVYYDDGDSQQWVAISGPTGATGFTGSKGAPGDVTTGKAIAMAIVFG